MVNETIGGVTLTLLATAREALPLAAADAQPIDGLYIGGVPGFNCMHREGFQLSTGTAANVDVRSNIASAVVLSLGWGFGNGFNAGLEASYRLNNGFAVP